MKPERDKPLEQLRSIGIFGNARFDRGRRLAWKSVEIIQKVANDRNCRALDINLDQRHLR